MTEPPDPEDDPLAALRERIERTQEAVDRLAAETARAQAGNGGSTPPPTEDAAAEAQALATLLQTVRELVPEDLWRQLAEVVRQLLLLLRAILDWWIDRLAPGERPGGPTIRDIPVD